MNNSKKLACCIRRWPSAGVLVVSVWCSAGSAIAQTTGLISESDFLTDMPIVLSVSRLPQRLDEAPGAVTILDREMIRLSGARDVADLLRLVPGFQTSTSFETGAPLASYHGGFDGYSSRMQVLVDGRSAYSPYLVGSVAPGLEAVALADIERIEVLRGSNSAAFGARAMLGVVNIITRHTVDTLGARAELSRGQNGIGDAMASVGWGQPNASYRLTVDRRADDGLRGSNGHNEINRVNLRADLYANAGDEIQLRVGGYTNDSGKGFPAQVGDALRDRAYSSAYAQFDWRRSLGVDADLAVSVSHTEEVYRESFPYAPVPGLTLDLGGRSSNDTASLVHTSRHGLDVRVVLGGEFSREQVRSKPLYNTDASLLTDFSRLFGNIEWRFAKDWLLNAGAMAENSSTNGNTVSPRLMFNWHFADHQTLRFGVSEAHRPISTLEQFGDVRYALNGVALQAITVARGNIQPEEVVAREIGYLGDFQRLAISLDVRAFHEQINGFVRRERYALPPGTTLFPSYPWDYRNFEEFAIHGLEYQLKWQPWHGARIIFGQTYTDIDSIDPGTALAAPKRASTLSYFQKLPGELDFSLSYQNSGKVTLQGAGADQQVAMSRTDLRLGLPLRWGAHKGELALVLQNLGVPYQDYAPQFTFERRAFVTLRLED